MKRIIAHALVLALLMLGCEGDPGLQEPRDGSQSAQPATGEKTRSGPSRDPGPATRPEPERTTEIIVTSDDRSLPEGCHPRQVARLVLDFTEAFNHGDGERLSRLFFVSEGPSPPDFSDKGYYPWSWYSVAEIGVDGRIERGFVTYSQGELLRYFAERHEHGERLQLLRVSLTGPGLLGEEGNVGIVHALVREADDLEPGLGGPDRVAFGKGAINCERRQIFAWSIEMNADEKRSAYDAADWLCGDPPGWRPGQAVVACD